MKAAIKKLLPLAIVIFSIPVIYYLSASAWTIQGSVAVRVPEIVKVAITAGFTVLLTAGTVWVFEKVGLDLRQYAVPVAATISTFAVTEVQDIINAIPENYDMILNVAFQIIVVLLGTIGFFRLRQRSPEENLL